MIAAICSREKSASIILQSKSQLKALHKDNESTIEGNCDTTLFFGGKEEDILKDLAEILGKETTDLYSVSYIIRYYVMSEGVSGFNELESNVRRIEEWEIV